MMMMMPPILVVWLEAQVGFLLLCRCNVTDVPNVNALPPPPRADEEDDDDVNNLNDDDERSSSLWLYKMLLHQNDKMFKLPKFCLRGTKFANTGSFEKARNLLPVHITTFPQICTSRLFPTKFFSPQLHSKLQV